jgi:hypothetical protein
MIIAGSGRPRETCDRERMVCRYVQAVDRDGTSRRALTVHLHGDDDGKKDKNKNTLCSAREKRFMLGGRGREQHHHRARSFIGLALVAVSGAWHVSVISRTPPPRAVSSSQTLVSSSHILPQHYHCHY